MSNIRVVSNRTIVKKVTLGVPVIASSGIVIQTNVGNITDVDAEGKQGGYVLIYDADQDKWKAQNLLNSQIIDGGDGF